MSDEHEQEQDEAQSATVSEVETQNSQKKTRVRLKSPRLQLQVTLQRMEKLAQSGTLKEGKAADLLMSMADLQKMLLQLDLDEKRDAAIQENETLKKETAAFRELNVTPEQVGALREENGVLNSQLELAQVNSRNDAATIASQQQEIETLKKNLLFAVQSVSDRSFAMRAFLALKGETRDECLNGAKVREWLQCEMAYPGKEQMLSYLHDHRSKKGCELQIAYCYARLHAEHGITPDALETLFAEQEMKEAKEKFEQCQNERIEAAKRETLAAARGIAGGHRDWNPEWRQPVPVEQQPAISGASDWSPWVK